MARLAIVRALRRPSRPSVEAFRDRQLRRLVRHAHERVPHYRRLLDRHGVDPGSIRTVDDLVALPTTSRRDLQALAPDEIVAAGANRTRLLGFRTSGSTGEPLQIRRAWLEDLAWQLFHLRAMRDLGRRLRDRHTRVNLSGYRVHAGDGLQRAVLRRVGTLRVSEVNCLRPPSEILAELRARRPDVISGLAGVLTEVARRAGPVGGLDARPRFVMSTGEVLTPAMRRWIGEAFGAPVHDLYSCHEVGCLAWECPETGLYHTCDDNVVVEVLRDGQPVREGERGEVVLTGLHAFTMPFIRYRLGDVVTRGPRWCPCGRPFSTIRGIQGRMLDYLVLPDGTLMHPYQVGAVLRTGFPWVRQYRFIQEEAHRVRMEVDAMPSPPTAEVAILEAEVQAILGPAIAFRVDLVPVIAPGPEGKFRLTRSLLASHYDAVDWSRL